MSSRTVNRSQSRCKVLLVSDSPALQDIGVSDGILDISNDAIDVSTNKTLTSAGKAAITLVPRRDYENLIMPNDVIVIYFEAPVKWYDYLRKETMEDSGFIRTFIGYVDRSQRIRNVAGDGTTSTRIQITCTDLQKAFERTTIYTNMFLTDAHKTAVRAFANMLGGIQFWSRGMKVIGTPATIVNSLMINFFGFGGQWQLPKNYPLPQGYLSKDPTKPINPDKPDDPKQFPALELEPSLGEPEPNQKDATTGTLETSSYSTPKAVTLSYTTDLKGAEKAAALKRLANQRTILDVLERRYIEAQAIDGITAQPPFANLRGSLWQLMQSFSNAPFNELFYDLRLDIESRRIRLGNPPYLPIDAYANEEEPSEPMAVDEFGVPVVAGRYRYVPAMVMRECPFDYDLEGPYKITSLPTAKAKEANRLELDKLDKRALTLDTLSKDLSLAGIKKEEVDNKQEAINKRRDELELSNDETIDNITLRFSPVFFSTPANPATVSRVEPRAEKYGAGLRSEVGVTEETVQRFVDAVPITEAEILKDTLGRSDAQVVNLIHLTNYYWGSPSLDIQYYRTFTPLMHPESIRRFGLRVFEHASQFALQFLTGPYGRGSRRAIVETIARWAILFDMWVQHNHEYLSGNLECRGRPDIRVGYRLDNTDRRESYYVEGVSHRWTYGEDGPKLRTTLAVTRGQPHQSGLSPERSRDLGDVLPYLPPVNLSFVSTDTNARVTGDRRFAEDVEDFIINSGFGVSRSPAYNRSTRKNI